MTLTIAAYRIDEEGVHHDIPLDSDLAGFESTRKTFYGSMKAVSLGLILLPRLEHRAVLVVDKEQFDDLLGEVRLLEEVAREDGSYDSYWRFRLNNLRSAIAAATVHERSAIAIG